MSLIELFFDSDDFPLLPLIISMRSSSLCPTGDQEMKTNGYVINPGGCLRLCDYCFISIN